MGYEPTANEDVVIQTNDKNIDLTVLIQEYSALKAEYLGLPQVKTTPDQETLNLYNAQVEEETLFLMNRIVDFYNRIKPIKDAGLLPSKYDNEYQQLENLVNG